ncbi:MAG TPA: esterase-like activity of phytase family protein, partial [Mycobacteriales bacterium]
MTGMRARWGALTGAALAAALVATAPPAAAAPSTPGGSTLVGRAVLPAATFAGGPASAQYVGPGPINGQQVPFRHQPVQGFSALVPVRGAAGDYWALADNGYGTEENSADFQLRIYRIHPDLGSARRTGGVKVIGHVDLADPDRRVTWTIVNFFTRSRLLTGADFDPESLQQAPDGSFWIGEEFGPFLLHVARNGKLLEAPIAQAGLRSPQNPGLEEAQSIRVMAALRRHAQQYGGATPVVSPDANMLADNDPATVIPSRAAPPAGSGVPAAGSEILNVATLHTAGFKVVPYTVDDPARMDALLRLGVDGLISDASDLLYQRV